MALLRLRECEHDYFKEATKGDAASGVHHCILRELQCSTD